MRFLLSSSSFRASLVSVRNLSSFRILRIFLRPLRSSPSCWSSSSSPLCGNQTSGSALWSSALRRKSKILSMINPALNNLQKMLQGWVQTTFCLSCMTWKVRYVDSTPTAMRKENFLECWRPLPSVAFQIPSRCWKRTPELWSCVASSFACNFSASPRPFWWPLYRWRETWLRQAGGWSIDNRSVGEGRSIPHLVFRCFPVFSDSLSSSLIPDSALELDFSYSESSDLSLSSD